MTMNFHRVLLFGLLSLVCTSRCLAQADPKPEKATTAVVRAFETHDIVMLGEFHDNKQLYEWLNSLVATPEFADRVDDIVVEMGNSLYQKSVDRYVSGADVPLEQVQKAWRNTVGSSGPQSPVYGRFYEAVRKTNMSRRGKHQIRILCGDPYIDWNNVRERADISPYLSHRDDWYAQVVKEDVLAKHRRALLIMGSTHFLRNLKTGPIEPVIEPELRKAGANTYLIIAGTNTVGGYDDLDHRFDSWPNMVISPATGWVGELPAQPLTDGGLDLMQINLTDASGHQVQKPSRELPKLKDAADALLYLGPRDSLLSVSMTRAELEGTPYLQELERRSKIQFPSFAYTLDMFPEKEDAQQFPRPEAEQTPPPPPPTGSVKPAGPTPAPAAKQPRPKQGPPALPPRPPPQ